MSKIRYGWYSVRQSKICGVIVYKTADGKEVEVTTVSPTMDHMTHWDDISYVGPVTDFVRRVSFGEMGDNSEFGDGENLTDEQLQRLHNKISNALSKMKKEKATEMYRWN